MYRYFQVTMATISVFLPTLFPCTSYPPQTTFRNKSSCSSSRKIFTDEDVELYTCNVSDETTTDGAISSYNEGKYDF